jgi:hypothetical protein
MRRLIPLLLILGIAGLPALASSYYFSPDVPTDLAGNTYLPWQIVRNDSGVFTAPAALAQPPVTAVDSLHAMCSGRWLFSVEAPMDLPLGGGVYYEPWDVIEFDPAAGTYNPLFCGGPFGLPPGTDIDAAFLRGGDAADLVISFDVPTDLTGLGGALYQPSDLVQLTRTGAACHLWNIVGLFFDSTTSVPPIPDTTNVTGSDRHGGQTMLGFDVASDLPFPTTYLPGQVVFWDPLLPGFGLYDSTYGAQTTSRIDAFSFLPGPGEVPTMHVDKSTLTAGDLTITWTASLSVGAEDYGIYEGTVSQPWGAYSHAAVDCHDNGSDLTEEITPASGNRYYLVVAMNPNHEGSYGQKTGGTERPMGSSPCKPSQDFDCP